MEREGVIELGAIENPSEEQLHYFLDIASQMEVIIEMGGISPEQAQEIRMQALRRIGMI